VKASMDRHSMLSGGFPTSFTAIGAPVAMTATAASRR
jgi:hypothetical protein